MADDSINIHDLPYFLDTKDGRRFSRAMVVLDSCKESGVPHAGIACRDMDSVSTLLIQMDGCYDTDAQMLLSEAVLSAIAVGVEIGKMNPQLAQQIASDFARRAADAKHSKPGGSRDKAQKIREIWASGKYSKRDVCAEQECAALGMSFSSARKALRNTPDPCKET